MHGEVKNLTYIFWNRKKVSKSMIYSYETMYSGMDQVRLIFGRQPFKNRPYHFKFLKSYLQQILLGPFLNTLPLVELI